MKNSEMTYCSDECLLVSMTTNTSLNDTGINGISQDEKSDPWK